MRTSLFVNAVMLIGFGVASFLTWRDQRKLTAAREEELEKLKHPYDFPLTAIEKRDLLDVFKGKAEEILKQIIASQTQETITEATSLMDDISKFEKKQLTLPMNDAFMSQAFTFEDACHYFQNEPTVIDPYYIPPDKITISALVKTIRGLEKVRPMIAD